MSFSLKNKIPLNKIFFTLVVLLSFTRTLNAGDYFVSIRGSDSNDGSESAPFRTIQKAASVMAAGDRCFIKSGTYRETVTILTDNISFEAWNNDTVIVSGADLVTGWTQHSGHIYMASFSGVQPQFTQVFYRSKYQKIARYPDLVTEDRLNIWDGYADCNVQAEGKVVFDRAPPGGTDHWKDGYFRGINGLTWWNPMGKITASSGKNLTCEMISKTWKQNNERSIGNGVGFILHLNALSIPGEWYYQNNTLYFWKPGGGQPTDTEVEAQKRILAFNLDGRSGITLKNLHIKAASMSMNNTSSCMIEGCSFRYQKGFYTRANYHWSYKEHGGIYVGGNNNTFNGCYFQGTWGNLVNLEWGNDNTFTNSIFEDNGWISQFTSCIQNGSNNLLVEHCTFGSTGRFHIRIEKEVRIDILHNDFYDCMKVGQDAGSLQITNGGSGDNTFDIKGSEIAYNTFRDMSTISSFFSTKNYVVALYLEGAANYTAHHNLCYNIRTQHKQGAFIYLGPRDCVIDKCKYYNNTAWDVDKMIGVWNRTPSLAGIEDMEYTNNIFYESAVVDFGNPSLESGVTFTTNLSTTDAGIFTDAAYGDFTLRDGSAAIDIGTAIPGITDGFQGVAPDAGCFEKGNTPWTCGAELSNPVFPEDAYVTLMVISGSGGGYYDEGDEVTISADSLIGREFIGWTGDVSYLANPDESPTTLVMPASDIRVTATYLDTAFQLTVDSGNGDGIYSIGTEVTITADSVEGKVFDGWTGDIDYLANPVESTTIVTMPAADVNITASYIDRTYKLTVNSGSGDGNYPEGAQVLLTAYIIEGKEFLSWEGDISYLTDPGESPIVIAMPAEDVTVTATYQDLPTDIHSAENEKSFILYPNPNSDHMLNIMINDPEDSLVTVSICGMDGSLLIQKQIQTNTQSNVCTDDISPGLYLVKAGASIQKLIRL